MSDTDKRALAILTTPHTCTELADRLWEKRTRLANRQSWARPAGKIIAGLVRDGLVRRVFPPEWEHRPALYQSAEAVKEGK